MATGKMSWQYYNNQQKHGQSYGNSSGNMGGDVQDMHLKMSKKIAQLTKVIYALNTKNDDNEAAMEALKDAHEEEMQQLLSETAAKIQQYRLKIGNELDLRRKVQNLEDCVESYTKERKLAVVEMDAFKHSVEERETELRSAHQKTVANLSRELLEAKAAFEQRIDDFENNMSSAERERHKNFDSVIMDYKSQIQNLNEQLNEQKNKFEAEHANLSESHSLQLASLRVELDKANQETKKCVEDYDGKMEKAKAFYERELMALKASSMSDEEMEKRWKDREARMKEESSRVELALRKRIKELTDEHAIQTDEIQSLNDQLHQSDAKANSTVDHIKDLRDQLAKLHTEYNATSDHAKFVEEELNTARERIDSQANDIIKKSSIIGTLEAIKLTQEESIRDLESQMKDLKKRYQDVDSERVALQKAQTDENGQLVQQLKVMGQRIQTMTDEKTALQKQFKRNLDELKLSHDEEVEGLKQQFENEANSMATNHQAEVDMMKTETQEAMDKLLREMQERIMKEASTFEEEKAAAISRLDEEKKEMKNELRKAHQEIKSLSDVISLHESGLGDASSRIEGLKSRISELENEVRDADGRRRTVEASAETLRADIKHQSHEHDRQVATLRSEHEEALRRLKRESEEKAEEETRLKLAELQARLASQYTDERREALLHLESRKEDELNAARAGWEEQIRQLSMQMTDMRNGFEAERHQMEHRVEEGRSEMTSLERRLRSEAQEAEIKLRSEMEKLIATHKMEIATLEQRKSDESRNTESKLLSQHREEMQSQMRAQQIALEALKDKMKREKMEEWERREQEFQQDVEEIKSQLQHQHSSTLDDVTRQYETQLATAKSSLEQQANASERKEEEYNRKLTDLEMELRNTTSQLNHLRDKVTEQNESLATVNRELDMKGQEILRVRSDAHGELRRREEELTRKFQTKQDRYEAETIRQKQAMVNDFNRATEALKDKLSSLNIALREAEEMYERRDSRPEDLDMINQLKELVRDRENQMQKLIDDKKYYQMELVNRETNFNKVFSAAPNVGVLNPRGKKKGQNTLSAPPRFTQQFVSVPNLNSIEPAMNGSNRLEPIRSGSTSPGGYKQLQPTPPQHPKKFLR
uniref:Protein FAM184A-like n=1 Tax=Phallusia mammillata TaxID=59560 RepID=A0A6F9DCK8_9ASCI|nr:protein FAM184A-like [Phallusia mammillata]